jgi:hypothetical protein
MEYLENAPSALIELHRNLVSREELYQQKNPGERTSILGRLLSDKNMQGVWTKLKPYLKNNKKKYKQLFASIFEAMRRARLDGLPPSDKNERCQQIARHAERLVKLMAEPKRPIDSPYRGELGL